MPRLLAYSRERLLGNHVPYPVEAWPEGARRQLAAESALYCRVFTEGLFGIDPVVFGVFNMKPNLPSGWRKMELRRIRSFGKTISFSVTDKGTEVRED